MAPTKPALLAAASKTNGFSSSAACTGVRSALSSSKTSSSSGPGYLAGVKEDHRRDAAARLALGVRDRCDGHTETAARAGDSDSGGGRAANRRDGDVDCKADPE